MMKLEQIVFRVLIAVVSMAACGTSNAAQQSAPSTTDSEALNRQIVGAIQNGRYADAVALARQAKVPKAESEFAVGEIILEGHSDAAAPQTPREGIEEGLQLIEAAALAGHQQAISALAAAFETGISQRPTETFLLRPDNTLSRCWEAAKEAPQNARACVALRKKH
jgi:hypothetical protein